MADVGPELTFPEGFIWGVATSSYQIEGAVKEDGRGESIWDTYCRVPGNVENMDNGDVACDHYHRYKEDVALMKSLGLKHYRFSIAWPRIFPSGNVDEVNGPGRQFYDNLINELLAADITPSVTLYHWDLPQALEDKFDGWRSRDIVPAFTEYARKCFEFYGDRVKQWITLNEPWCSAVLGYCTGDHAPGRTDAPGEEPYVAGHHLLLAHAHAVDLYRKEFQEAQGGSIGITLNTNWWEPLTDTEDDKRTVEVALAFFMGWFADPIFRDGNYPEIMREVLQDRLPTFSEEEQKLLKGSSDFLGLNHYTTTYAGVPSITRHLVNLYQIIKMSPSGLKSFKMAWRVMTARHHYFKDVNVLISLSDKEGMTDMGWPIAPWGMGKLLEYLHKEYNHPIYVFENGMAVKARDVEEAVNDTERLSFMYTYLAEMHKAIKNGADVRGFYYWSFMDNFEWACGNNKRFGLIHIDYDNGQTRTPKSSAFFFKEVVTTNALPSLLEKDSLNIGFELLNRVQRSEDGDKLMQAGTATTKNEADTPDKETG
eukprot:CAMPEP_0119133958 /NCGR_PEP_ID=MMETSP1310-20130426/14756_1 /TAXON_ID=464262 /ORGANISM="Genus nov. species nov., Strain RCC2339" /LENGTH=538 /DNA_ID=CAMNT_0007124693 /DNA_START=78 /DNA_END=1691 /DNA_ORIENTATION=+